MFVQFGQGPWGGQALQKILCVSRSFFKAKPVRKLYFPNGGGRGLNNLPQFGSLGVGLVNELIALFDFHGHTVLLQMKKEEMKNC